MEIYGTCDDPNFTTTPVVSDILDAPDPYGADDGIGGYLLKSFGKVKDDAPHGTWPVHFMCGTTKVETTFTVEISIVEESVRPGQKVTVRLVCTVKEFRPSVLSSSALTDVPMFTRPAGAAPEDPMTVRATVDPDAKPGTHPVSYWCGEWMTGEFTVDAAAPPTTRPVAPAPQVPVKPKGAADTGSLDPAPSRESNAGALALTLGGLAVFAGGGGLLAYRRRQKA